MIIAVQNQATLVSGEDVYSACLLVDRQLREHAAPAHGLLPPAVVYLGTTPPAQRYDAIITVMDDTDQAGDLGWHTEGPDASYYGRVFARPVLENGGDALTNDLSVCSVLSHECLETLLDRSCDLWAQAPDGTLFAYELGDPVESDSYAMAITTATGETVAGTVSNFVLPSWFDETPAPGPHDYMGLVTEPFQVRSTGYAIVMSGGVVSQQWGEHYPAWRKATKEALGARTARRALR